MCVNKLSKVALDSAEAGIEPATSSHKSNALTIAPPSHTRTSAAEEALAFIFRRKIMLITKLLSFFEVGDTETIRLSAFFGMHVTTCFQKNAV